LAILEQENPYQNLDRVISKARSQPRVPATKSKKGSKSGNGCNSNNGDISPIETLTMEKQISAGQDQS
jgi:hypothetical protein